MADSEDGGVSSIVKVSAETVAELAKAGQEQQKTYQAAIDLVRRIGGYLGGVFGPASHELSLLFGEQMRFWRFKNAVKILENAEALVEQRGIKPEQIRALGFGEGLLLLEAASLEQDETVQQLWARLVANAVDPKERVKPEKVYLDLLKSISGREAILLDLVAQIEEKGQSFRDIQAIDAFGKEMIALAESKWRQFSADERAISIQNLVRLRCLIARPRPLNVGNLFAHFPRDQVGRNIVPLPGSQWAAIDPQKFEAILTELFERQMAASGMIDFKGQSSFVVPTPGFFQRGGGRKIDLPEANFMLTPLGRDLMRACREPTTR